MLLVECYRLDVAAIAAKVPGWSAWQDTTSDGTKNSAVLYRSDLAPTAHGCDHIIDASDLRPRSVCWIKLPAITLGADHRPPGRDANVWPKADANLGAWARNHSPAFIGMDSNAKGSQVADMEKATGLTWHGAGIIGGLVTGGATVTGVRALPMLSSDHPPVEVTITLGGKP